MTSSLVLLGDSLVDTGNTTALARLVRQDPFAAALYNGGGNRKASDGPVLAEQIALRLGARLGSTTRVNLLSLPLQRLAGGFDSSTQLWNFAYAGASSGLAGSRRAGLARFPLGLVSQALVVAANAPRRADVDALIVAGSNDLIDLVDRPGRVLRVLRTAGRRDDRNLIRQQARRIVANTRRAVDTISGNPSRGGFAIDEAVILGLSPLSQTPVVREVAAGLQPALGRGLRGFVDQTARLVNRQLKRRYNSPRRDDGVEVIDGFQVWNSVARPRFLDDVHPTAATAGRLADAVVQRIAASADLSSYGFSA